MSTTNQYKTITKIRSYLGVSLAAAVLDLNEALQFDSSRAYGTPIKSNNIDTIGFVAFDALYDSTVYDFGCFQDRQPESYTLLQAATAFSLCEAVNTSIATEGKQPISNIFVDEITFDYSILMVKYSNLPV